MRNLVNSSRAFQLKAVKGDFSARREEVRRDFQAPAQGSDDPNPVVLSSAAPAPGPGADALMPDASVGRAPTPTPAPDTARTMPPPTYIPPRAKVKVQQKAVARTAPLAEP